MWESQVLLTDGQVVFLRVLRFSPTFDERSARYKWNILERAVKPKSKKKKKKKKKINLELSRKVRLRRLPMGGLTMYNLYTKRDTSSNSVDPDGRLKWAVSLGFTLFAIMFLIFESHPFVDNGCVQIKDIRVCFSVKGFMKKIFNVIKIHVNARSTPHYIVKKRKSRV